MKSSILCLVLIMMLSCSTSKITSSWKQPNITTTDFKKIMVVAITNPDEMNLQKQMEKHLVGDIKAFGYNAVSSFEQFGPMAFKNMKEEEMLSKIKNSGADAVVTIVLLNKQKERYYRPEEIMQTPFANEYGKLNGYYNNIQNRVVSKGYYITSTSYFWESNFYDLFSNKLIFAAHTKSFEANSTNALAHGFGKIIVTNMYKKGVLKNKNSILSDTIQ
jgi:hypothetical protein